VVLGVYNRQNRRLEILLISLTEDRDRQLLIIQLWLDAHDENAKKIQDFVISTPDSPEYRFGGGCPE
jgi:hypothetical protein